MGQTYKVPANIAWRQVDDEVVVLDLNTSVYYSFNEVGAAVWELLAQSLPPEDVAKKVAADFDADVKTVSSDVKDFVKGLTKEKLLQGA